MKLRFVLLEKVSSLFLILIFSQFMMANAASAAEELVDVFIAPESVAMKMPDYPSQALRLGQEGLVQINFMIDTNGEVFEPIVTAHAGSDEFLAPALKAIRRSTFEPATLNGEPVVGSEIYIYRFMLSQKANGSSVAFSRNYKDFEEVLAKDDEQLAKKALGKLSGKNTKNHYENAFLKLAEFSFAEKYSGSREQMLALHGALSYSTKPDDAVYFDKAAVVQMRRKLFILQVQNRFFSEAIKTFHLLESTGDEQGVELYVDTVKNLLALRENDVEYNIDLSLSDDGQYWMSLFKNKFFITGGEGAVTEVFLRCDKQYLSFTVERDFDYSVSDDVGKCSIHFKGNGGATFSLVQH